MFPDPLIDDPLISDPLALVVVLAAVVLVALELEERVTLFRSLGAALVGILIGMLLSNLEVIPGESPVYDFLQGTGVNIGIVLIPHERQRTLSGTSRAEHVGRVRHRHSRDSARRHGRGPHAR